MNKRLLFLLLILPLSLETVSLRADSSGNGVGNGGDILTSYLETVRFSFIRTIRDLKLKPAAQKSICELQDKLNFEQKEECRRFIVSSLDQWIQLNTEQRVTPFSLQQEPIWVLGPEGERRPVDAKTQLGERGGIDFYYSNIKYFSPIQLLRLMVHEFGHKVRYLNAWVEDNSPTQTFSLGREFLDQVGLVVASYAESHGFIDQAFTLNDHFLCTVDTGAPHHILTHVGGVSPRHFANPADFDVYDVTVGKRPSDLEVFIWEQKSKTSKVSFQIEIHDESGCKGSFPEKQWTKLELVRTFTTLGESLADEVLWSQTYMGLNPICEAPPSRTVLEASFKDIRFECVYSESIGSLAAAVRK